MTSPMGTCTYLGRQRQGAVVLERAAGLEVEPVPFLPVPAGPVVNVNEDVLEGLWEGLWPSARRTRSLREG